MFDDLTNGHPVCQWYAMCDQAALFVVTHPVLGNLFVCDRCHDRHDLADQVVTRWEAGYLMA